MIVNCAICKEEREYENVEFRHTVCKSPEHCLTKDSVIGEICHACILKKSKENPGECPCCKNEARVIKKEERDDLKRIFECNICFKCKYSYKDEPHYGCQNKTCSKANKVCAVCIKGMPRKKDIFECGLCRQSTRIYTSNVRVARQLQEKGLVLKGEEKEKLEEEKTKFEDAKKRLQDKEKKMRLEEEEKNRLAAEKIRIGEEEEKMRLERQANIKDVCKRVALIVASVATVVFFVVAAIVVTTLVLRSMPWRNVSQEVLNQPSLS